ncbi:hypothetical protein C0989_004570, partial [Termitomyces sp. Mn162]
MVKQFTQVLKRWVPTPGEALHTEVKHVRMLLPTEASTVVDATKEAVGAVPEIGGTVALHASKASKGQMNQEYDIEHLPVLAFLANVLLAAKAGSIQFLVMQTVNMPHASYPMFVLDADNCLDEEIESIVLASWIGPAMGAHVHPASNAEDEVAET